jgi:hypothetical protein
MCIVNEEIEFERVLKVQTLEFKSHIFLAFNIIRKKPRELRSPANSA